MFNAGGFYDGLLGFLDSVVREGFVREPHRGMLIVGTEPTDVVARIRAYEPPQVIKWVKAEER